VNALMTHTGGAPHLQSTATCAHLEWFDPVNETIRVLPIKLPPLTSYEGHLCILRYRSREAFYLDISDGGIDHGIWRPLPAHGVDATFVTSIVIDDY
jgi:hypothetical protein